MRSRGVEGGERRTAALSSSLEASTCFMAAPVSFEKQKIISGLKKPSLVDKNQTALGLW